MLGKFLSAVKGLLLRERERPTSISCSVASVFDLISWSSHYFTGRRVAVDGVAASITGAGIRS